MHDDQGKQCLVKDQWQFERDVRRRQGVGFLSVQTICFFQISLRDEPRHRNGSILKATMTREHILIQDSSSPRPRTLPGKHVSMKVVFHL